MRPVTVLATGGTIAMRGAQATPALDGEALVDAIPELGAVPDLEIRSVRNLPGVQIGLADALEIARAATALAGAGRGVVVTHGTDTLEETAVLCDVVYGGEAPIVFTGAMRPATAPGADGPANLLDAVALAAAPEAAGLGALVAFAGEVHAARAVRKADSTGPAAFASPLTGPIGAVRDGRVAIAAHPARRPPVVPDRLDARVPIVPTALGDDGSLLRAAAAGADGLVAVALGAGHVPPTYLDALAEAAARLAVVVTVRPERGAILHETYGFRGSERDVRATKAIPAGALSPAAARMVLLACLGAGLNDAGVRAAFAVDDV